MVASQKEKSAEIELSWSFGEVEHNGARAMKLEYEIEAFEELFVSDRLWDYDASRARVPEPRGVYRFVRSGSLRLLFGQAPLPFPIAPRVIYQPLYSRILKGEKHRREVLLELPVEEYSSLARNVEAPTVVEELTKVFFVIGYRLRSDLDADPKPPLNEGVEVGYIVAGPTLLVSALDTTAPFQVKRRTGSMPRFVLPGEAVEARPALL